MRDPFDLMRPRSQSREGRLLLLAEAADALLGGVEASLESRLFAGACLAAWIRDGGPFEAYARIGAPRGSHRTHPRLYSALIGDEESEILDCGIVGSSLFEEPQS